MASCCRSVLCQRNASIRVRLTRWCGTPQATLDVKGYLFRLGLVWTGFFLLIGGPIAYQTFDPYDQVHSPYTSCFASSVFTFTEAARRFVNCRVCNLVSFTSPCVSTISVPLTSHWGSTPRIGNARAPSETSSSSSPLDSINLLLPIFFSLSSPTCERCV